MSYTLATAPWYVLVHLGLSLAALGIGIWQLSRKKGDRLHKALGWAWASFMLTTAAISFAIQARSRFSLIHALSVVVLITVPLGLFHARHGNIKAHRYTMVFTFAGLAIAGAFTLLPYRMLGQLVFAAP
jgi:uncharacterized membrane protein